MGEGADAVYDNNRNWGIGTLLWILKRQQRILFLRYHGAAKASMGPAATSVQEASPIRAQEMDRWSGQSLMHTFLWMLRLIVLKLKNDF